MSYAPAAHCDVCGQPKRQTNHWFQARVSVKRISIEPFNAQSKAVKHLCGQACALKLISSLLVHLGLEQSIGESDAPVEFPLALNDS